MILPIEFVQRSNIYKIDYIPERQSHYMTSGHLNKIQAFDAWNITQGSDSVLAWNY